MPSIENAFADAGSIPRQLAALSAAVDPFTRASLEQIGIQSGWQILDVGAGSGTISTWLANRVGPTGMVTATDLDPSLIPEHPAITALRHDITTDELPYDYYDLVHARLVLSHLKGREEILRRAYGTLRPGGWLVLHEFDYTYRRHVYTGDPEGIEVFDAVNTAINQVLAAAGTRLSWGSMAHHALQRTGFADISTRVAAETFRGGDPWARLSAANTVQSHDQLLAAGLADADLEHFRRLMHDPDFTAMSYLMTRTVGRRPA